jgi:hypothetical protein
LFSHGKPRDNRFFEDPQTPSRPFRTRLNAKAAGIFRPFRSVTRSPAAGFLPHCPGS